MVTRLDKIRKQILGDFELIREVDFNKDIDISISGIYRIEKDKNYLQLISSRAFEPDLKNFFVSYGDILQYEEGLGLLPVYRPGLTWNPYRFSAYMEKPLDRDKDILYFSIKRSADAYLYFRLCNSYIMELYGILKSGEHILDENAFEQDDAKSIDYIFLGNKLYVIKRCGTQQSVEDAISITLEGLDNDFLINCKDNYILIDHYRFKLPFEGFIKEKETGISIFGMCSEIEPTKCLAKLSRVSYGEEAGTIYLNPIKVNVDEARIFMVYNGDPCLQLYDAKMDLWMDIGNGDKVKLTHSIRLRLRVRSSDRIYGIFVVEVQNNRLLDQNIIS